MRRTWNTQAGHGAATYLQLPAAVACPCLWMVTTGQSRADTQPRPHLQTVPRLFFHKFSQFLLRSHLLLCLLWKGVPQFNHAMMAVMIHFLFYWNTSSKFHLTFSSSCFGTDSKQLFPVLILHTIHSLHRLRFTISSAVFRLKSLCLTITKPASSNLSFQLGPFNHC